MSAVFYAEKYHPIQAGSIDGTDVAPHDNAVLRALLCSSAGLYDSFGDPKTTGDPYCTLFVGRLSRQTDDETLRKAMCRYGRVKSVRLVRDIVTGASRGYAFVEYETDREMCRAYEDAHHSIIDGSEVIVDYYRQQLMPGWIPRRRPIPYDELKKLGIPPPPVEHYMTRFQVPPPPRRKSGNIDREDSPPRRRSKDRADSSYRKQRSPTEDEGSPHRRKSSHDWRKEPHRRVRSSTSRETSSYSRHRSPTKDDDDHRKQRRSRESEEISPDREDGSCKRGRTSAEAGYSPHRSHQRRHRRGHPRDSSSRSLHRDGRHHDDRAHSRRSESRGYSH